jgi:hypothetical protein
MVNAMKTEKQIIFGNINVRFEAFKAVPMKNAVFWEVALCGSVKADVSEERSFLQDQHGATSRKTAFLNINVTDWLRVMSSDRAFFRTSRHNSETW